MLSLAHFCRAPNIRWFSGILGWRCVMESWIPIYNNTVQSRERESREKQRHERPSSERTRRSNWRLWFSTLTTANQRGLFFLIYLFKRGMGVCAYVCVYMRMWFIIFEKKKAQILVKFCLSFLLFYLYLCLCFLHINWYNCMEFQGRSSVPCGYLI